MLFFFSINAEIYIGIIVLMRWKKDGKVFIRLTLKLIKLGRKHNLIKFLSWLMKLHSELEILFD